MKCKVLKSTLSGQIACPPNKSYTHRAVFLAALAGNSTVENALFSADTEATIRACKSFGATITQKGTSIIIRDKIMTDFQVPEIDVGNSGTTIRIAAGIASLFPRKITLTGDQSIQKRPMRPLLDALERIGAKCISKNGKPPITVAGKITGGDISISGSISSQFVSALLVCAPLTLNGIKLSITDDLVSRPYLDATISAMGEFGVRVMTQTPYKQYVISPQTYRPTTFRVPIDSSSLALLLSAAVLNGKNLSILGMTGNMPQGDMAFVDILGDMGADVRFEGDKISVDAPELLDGGSFDLGNSPDLLPALSILVLKTSKPITIYNVRHARFKETDRISILHRELSKVGVFISERDDGLVLSRSQNLHGAVLNPQDDHRLFMAFCLVGMFVGNCTVMDPESVAVSYPDFIDDMNRVGAAITIQEI